jgi:hypothetical protein
MEASHKKLPKIWSEFLVKKPETGMGYQVVSLHLQDGRRINDVVIVESSLIVEIRGQTKIDFDPHEISEIELTHRKWKFEKK